RTIAAPEGDLQAISARAASSPTHGLDLARIAADARAERRERPDPRPLVAREGLRKDGGASFADLHGPRRRDRRPPRPERGRKDDDDQARPRDAPPLAR